MNDAMARKRILFFAEAVTLAHVARPIALAQGLDPSEYECTIACDQRYAQFLSNGPWRHVQLGSIPSPQFLQALAHGSPVYDLPTLQQYVRDDLALIEQHQPDVVVGDFRLSLSVSARLAKVPYIAISNAYWSPYYARPGFPMPVLPMTRFLPIPVAQAIFALARPFAFPLHCRPMNALRVEHGLLSLGNDLRRVYTDADLTLYADDPKLFELKDAPPNHRLIGPLMWEPRVAMPSWWDKVPSDRPVVYVTLGSSGPQRTLTEVLRALEHLPVTVLAATAGAVLPTLVGDRTFVAPYLPGTAAAQRSALVICNGGSLTCNQALAANVPVLGIASNMDQFMNMNGLVNAGRGMLQRADRFDPGTFRSLVRSLLIERPILGPNLSIDQREPVHELQDALGQIVKCTTSK